MDALVSGVGRSSMVGEAANGHGIASSAAMENNKALAGSPKSASSKSISGFEGINPMAVPQLNLAAKRSSTLGSFSSLVPGAGRDRDQSNFDHLLGQVQQAHTEEIEVLQQEIASLQRKVNKLGRVARPRGRSSNEGHVNWGEASLSISSGPLGSSGSSSWKMAMQRERVLAAHRQIGAEETIMEVEGTDNISERGIASGPVGEEPLLQMPKNSAVTSAVGDVRHWPEELKAGSDVTSWVRNALTTELEEASIKIQAPRILIMEEDKNEYLESDQGGSEDLDVEKPSSFHTRQRSTLSKRSSKSSAGSMKATRSLEELDGTLIKWRELVLDLLALASKELFIMKPCWVQSETFLRKAHRGAHHYLDLFADTRQSMSKRRSDASVKSQNTGHLHFPHWNPLRDVNHLIVDPQSPRRMIWALVGMFLMIYDLIMLPMQAFELPDNVVITGLSWMFQIFWTLDMGVSAVTSYYVNGELETRIGRIVRTYATTWMPVDAVITLPLWVILIMGWDTARTGNSVRSARYFRMLRFLRLMRLVKFEALWGEALGFVNSASAILVIGMAKLMFLMILLNHLVACVWFAIGKSGGGWARTSKIQDGDILYKYLSSIHWTLTQFQGTSDVTPGGTLAERTYAVLFLLMALFILTIFISSLTNRMMQFQNLHSQRTYEERVVRGYLSNHDITHQLSVRIKKYLEWKQRLKQIQEYDEEVFNILPLQLMMDLLDEVRGPTCSDNHPFFSAFREAYPRVMRRLCYEAMTPTSPMPGEQVFSPGDLCTGMYFVVNGHVNYNVSTDKRMCRQKSEQDKGGPMRIKSQRMTMQNRAYGNVSSMKPRQTLEELSNLGLMNVTPLTQGHFLSEAVLWTFWHHVGTLHVVSDSMLLVLHAQRFEEVVSIYAQAHASALLYARRFLASLNSYGKHYTDYINRNHLQEMIDTHNEEMSESEEEDDWSDDESYEGYDPDQDAAELPRTSSL